MWFEKTFEEEIQRFNSSNLEWKEEIVKNWVDRLSNHYDYFYDLKIYIDNHESELDEEFLDAVFQIIINLAKKIEKL